MKFSVTVLASALAASVLAAPQDGATVTSVDTSSTMLIDSATATISSMAEDMESSMTTTSSVSSFSTVPMSPQASCAATCPADDVRCRASCVSVPSGDEEDVNRTTECVGNCPKGNGTEADNAEYGRCVEVCLGQFVSTNPIVATGAPMTSTMAGGVRSTVTAARSSIATMTGSQSTATETSGAEESDSTGSATRAAASTSATGTNAAANVQIGGSLAGLAGLLMLALNL